MPHKKSYLPHLLAMLLLGFICLLSIYIFSVPTLNLSPLENGKLPIIALEWDGSTLQPTYNKGYVQLENASVYLDLPGRDPTVLKSTEEFLRERVTAAALEQLLPSGHQFYGLLNFGDNYWAITGKNPSAPYVVALGNFHQREEPEPIPVKYQKLYRSKMTFMHSSSASMSGAYCGGI